MTWHVWRSLADWLGMLRGTGGYRGLVVIHAAALRAAAGSLTDRLAAALGDGGVCVAPAEYRADLVGACSRLLSPSAIEELLGTEAGYVVLLVPKLLRPNLVAAAAETVRAGGVVALVAPPLHEWRPGGEATIGAYKRYIIGRLGAARSIFWADLDFGTVYASKVPGCCARRPPGPGGYKPSTPMPRRLLEAAATLEQAQRLDEIVGFLRGRGRSVFIVGDRGRGKSGLMALTAAYLIHSHMVGFVSVTAPSVWNVQSFFKVLDEALDRLGVRHWSVRRHGVVVGVAGPWFHVRYHTPDQATPGPYMFIDEAAALGPSRLRALAARSPRVIASTTIHGYEGSGRVLAHIAENVLPEPLLRVELQTPVRYPPGDPLEEWLYETFMLRAEEPPTPSEAKPDAVTVRAIDRLALAEDYETLRHIYAILVTAHYRNEPDDLALMLDAPHHRLYVAEAGGSVVAAADVAEEEPSTPWEHRILYDKLADASTTYTGTRGWRVVRIAVHPQLQRRGIGSRLLSAVEDEARREGADWLGAIYGRSGVTRFWLRNGFLPVYVSPLPSRATGEHNIGVAKGLTRAGTVLVEKAACGLLERLLWGLPSLYRSLDPQVASVLLEGAPELSLCRPMPEVSPLQLARLRRAAGGQAEPESALDAMAAALQELALLHGGLWVLDDEERLAATARVLQGRTPRELRHLIPQGSLRQALYRLAALLLCYAQPSSA